MSCYGAGFQLINPPFTLSISLFSFAALILTSVYAMRCVLLFHRELAKKQEFTAPGFSFVTREKSLAIEHVQGQCCKSAFFLELNS